MAAYLTHGSEQELSKYDLWRKAWPTRQDFEDSLPMLWPTALGGLTWPDNDPATRTQPNVLPPCISGRWNTIQKDPSTKKYETEHQNLLAGQEQRLGKAWADVTTVLPETDWRSFSYHWLILNTRSFYWVAPDQEPPEDRNDAMALLPFADYFNHSDVEVCFFLDGFLTTCLYGDWFSAMSSLTRMSILSGLQRIMKRATKSI